LCQLHSNHQITIKYKTVQLYVVVITKSQNIISQIQLTTFQNELIFRA